MIPAIIRAILFVVFYAAYYSFRLFIWLLLAAFGMRNCLLAVADLTRSQAVARAATDAGLAGGLQRVRIFLDAMLQGPPEPSVAAPDEQPKGDF